MRFGGYRRWGGIALVSGIGAVLGSAGGCTANQQTELVPGVVSQIQVPRTMKAIRVDVQPQGQQSTCFIRSVDPNTGGATLPRTLGIVPSGDVSRLVTVTVTGYEISDSDPMAPPALQDCLTSPFNNGKYDSSVKILRRTRQPYVDGRILFLPMPLRYACWEGEQCMDTETCVAGKCQDALTDPHKLVDFDPTLVDGTADTCFSLKTCLADKVPAQVVDQASCLYTYPPQVPTPRGPGINVRMYFDNAEAEVLDLDAQEGFTVPDPSKPQQFQLAPNLCDIVNGRNMVSPRKVIEIDAATQCVPKTLLQPICADEQGDTKTLPDGGSSTDGGCNIANVLQPAPSALYVLLDDNQDMAPVFGKMGLNQVLSFSLSDPVFRTTSVGMKFLPHSMADCNTGAMSTSYSMSPDVPFGPAAQVQTSIANLVGMHSPQASNFPLFLDAALQANAAYKALLDFQTSSAKVFNRMAVLLIFNRDFAADCGMGHVTAMMEAANALAAANPANRVYTYVVMLGNSNPMPQNAGNAQALAMAGGTNFFDAQQNPAVGAQAFNSIVSDLGSCLYEQPMTIDKTAVLSYTDPLSQQTTMIQQNAGCSEANQASATGWNFDPGNRVRICGSDCNMLRTVISNAADFALAMNMPAPNVPVTSTQLCK